MKKLLLLCALLVPGQAFAGNAVCVSAVPTLTVGAYSSGQLMGGLLTFSGALDPNVGSGHITSVNVTDKAAQAVDLDVVIFDQNPTATTFTNAATFAPNSADLTKIRAAVNLGSSSRFAFSANSVHYSGSLAMPVQALSSASASSTLYGALVARGAYTAASVSDATVIVCIARD